MRKSLPEQIKSALESGEVELIISLLKNPSLELKERILLLEKAVELGKEEFALELELLKKASQKDLSPELDKISLEGFSGLVKFFSEQKDSPALENLLQMNLSKEKIKQVKKALHRLRSSGIDISLEKPEAKTWQAQETIYKKWIKSSPVLSFWANLLIFYFASGVRGNQFLLAQINLEEGFKEIELLSLAEKEAKKIINQAGEQSRARMMIELEEEHFLWLMGYALCQTGSEQLKKQAGNYLEKLNLKPQESSWDNHPISELKNQISPEEQIGLLYDADKLLEHPYFQSWGFELETLQECSRELESALTSPLQLSEAQLQQRLEGIIRKYSQIQIKENPSKIQFALWENAYLLEQAGEKELGKIALSLAENLSHPRAEEFFFYLLLSHFPKLKEKLKPKSQIIITP